MNNQTDPSQFLKEVQKFRTDPYSFVLFSYPWGKKGTFLYDEKGPDTWQIEVMETIRQKLEERQHNPNEVFAAIQIAVASGHGIGKTALICWLIHWFICCYENPQIVVTAGTMSQLMKKTWRELSKWHKVSLQFAWFKWTATKFFLKEQPEDWYASCVPWSEHNSDAFAGTHGRYVMYLFDEASTIADKIWEVSEGAMTTEVCIWIAFGNPVRNTGRFKACFGKFRKWWINMRVDSRTARMANQKQIAQWAEQYGEDSDFFKTRVKGEHPVQATNQLISEEAVERCMTEYKALAYEGFPIRIGCDVARFGDDYTVITVMQGRKCHEIVEIHKRDLVFTYTKLMNCFHYYKTRGPSVTFFIDDDGLGGGLTDMLNAQNMNVIGVKNGGTPMDEELFVNKRIEMWWTMAEAIREGLELPQHERLKSDLTNIEYSQNPTNMKFRLESRESLLKRDLSSPDFGTSLALTLAFPVAADIQSVNKITKAAGGGLKTRKRGR